MKYNTLYNIIKDVFDMYNNLYSLYKLYDDYKNCNKDNFYYIKDNISAYIDTNNIIRIEKVMENIDKIKNIIEITIEKKEVNVKYDIYLSIKEFDENDYKKIDSKDLLVRLNGTDEISNKYNSDKMNILYDKLIGILNSLHNIYFNESINLKNRFINTIDRGIDLFNQ